MKKLVILFLLWLPFSIFAQVKTTVISLNLTEEEKEAIYETGRKPRLTLQGYEMLEAQKDRLGNWHFVLPDPETQYATLSIEQRGSCLIYITSGMKMSVFAMPGKKYSYKGDGEAINNYLSGAPSSGISMDEFKLGEEEMLAMNRERLAQAYRSLDQAKLGKGFTVLEKERLRLLAVNKLDAYISLYGKVNGVEYTPSQELIDYITAQFRENEDLFFLDEYKDLAANVVKLNWKSPVDAQNREDETLSKINYVLDHFKGEKIRDHFIGNIIITHIRQAGLKDTARIEPLFRTYVKDPVKLKQHRDLCDKLTSEVDKIKNKSANGKVKCPSFRFKDINGKEVALEDFRGKYVYIDCWATWCGPCKAELPALQKLEEKYKDRNIVFVSISSDKDKKAWEKMVKLDKLGGVQLNIDGDHSFHSAMKINSIPRFMLIDPEGYFVSDNATRPSNSQTEILFDSLKGL